MKTFYTSKSVKFRLQETLQKYIYTFIYITYFRQSGKKSESTVTSMVNFRFSNSFLIAIVF